MFTTSSAEVTLSRYYTKRANFIAELSRAKRSTMGEKMKMKLSTQFGNHVTVHRPPLPPPPETIRPHHWHTSATLNQVRQPKCNSRLFWREIA